MGRVGFWLYFFRLFEKLAERRIRIMGRVGFWLQFFRNLLHFPQEVVNYGHLWFVFHHLLEGRFVKGLHFFGPFTHLGCGF